MDIKDIIFAGQCEVVLIKGHGEFVTHTGGNSGVTTYLAGSYADAVMPERVESDQAAGLFGQFVLLRHDSKACTLTVLTDRFGIFPFYMAQDKERLYLSTDFSTLARQCSGAKSPDHGAMSDILGFNVPLGQRTISTSVTAFGGSMEVTVDLNTLALRSRKLWNPVELLAHADLSFNRVKDRLVDLFLEGVALAAEQHGTVSVTLSGGADSRCVLAASLYANKNTVVYSTGVPGSRALTYAWGMAKLCNVPANLHPLDDSFLARLPALMYESNKLMQGMSFSSELEAMWLRQHVAPKGVLLHGAFAELCKIGKMHNFYYDKVIAGLTGGAVSEQLWKRFSVRYALRRQGFDKVYGDVLGEQAHQHLADKVARYQLDLDTAGVLQMIYIDEFLGKVTKASWNMWRRCIPTFFPFAYPPLIDLILRVRTADKVDSYFVAYLLKRTNTILARYPDSNTGVRIGASRLHRELVHVADYATSRLFRTKTRSDHQDFADWLSRMRPGLEPLFEGLQAATGALNMTHVQQLIGRCRAGEDLSARTLQFLWSWGLWKMG